MTNNTPTPRRAFEIGYRYARNLQHANPALSAASIADQVVRIAMDNGFDYRPFLEVSNAILWAMHWRFKQVRKLADGRMCAPNKDVPLGMSERHMGFEAGPDYCNVWFARKLP